MGYNQSNVLFNLNVENTTIGTLVNSQRDSVNDERNDFWIAYFIIAYQGGVASDFDGVVNNLTEASTEGISSSTPLTTCDCYNNPNCPSGYKNCSSILQGGDGSVIYQEVLQDVTEFFRNLPPPMSRELNDTQVTTAHEIGHQFGLKGDKLGTQFKIMDYPDYANNAPVVEIAFHPEHVNILRRRVSSPGQ